MREEEAGPEVTSITPRWLPGASGLFLQASAGGGAPSEAGAPVGAGGSTASGGLGTAGGDQVIEVRHVVPPPTAGIDLQPKAQSSDGSPPTGSVKKTG